MSDDSLKQLFDALPAAPRPEAKAQARAAALAAFDEANADDKKTGAADQGFADRHRLTPDTTKQGSKHMYGSISKKQQKPWHYAGMATAAVLFLAVFITQLPSPRENVISVNLPDPARTKLSERKAGTDLREQDEPPPPPPDLKEPPPFIPPPEVSLAPEVSVAGHVNSITAARKPSYDMRSVQSKSLSAPALSIARDAVQPPAFKDEGRDRFEATTSNPIKKVSTEPVSTFSIDVDTSSYSFVRRQLNEGVLPQKAAVRLEEMVNYFPYDYAPPANAERPFSTKVTVIDSPWKTGNKLVHIGIKGYELQGSQPKSNLVFLLDVSGSMDSPDKLPLVKQSMEMLLTRLRADDTVAIVVYAGAAGTVLEPTPVKEKGRILAALNQLSAGGSTAGGDGIRLAYQLAESRFIKDGVNRIILATDGDFNVGITDTNELEGFIERKRKSGVFLSVLGFGQGNYQDELMQKLAQNGNGVAAYIDTLNEARKVLVDEATSMLFPIARDVKIQVEFNPATVSEYRLLGYETRMLAEEDFNNDAVDAGDIGSGHTVTAIYEITPAGSASAVFSQSRYGDNTKSASKGSEYGFLKLRYKLPKADASQLISEPIAIDAKTDSHSLQETRFATAVAGFAQLLQGNKHIGNWNYQNAIDLAQTNRGDDPFGYRAELVQLIRKAKVADAM